MGDSAAHGGGFFDIGEKVVFPPGYPALLAVLMRAGLGHSWAIIGINVIFLSVGLFATYFLLIREFFESKAIGLIICSFFLLSFVVVKHFTIPLTDIPFFCCSMCCLAVMRQTTKMNWNWRFLILAAVAWFLAIAAITVRRIGVSLVPALVGMIVCSPHLKSLLKSVPRRTKQIIVVLTIFAGIGTTYVVVRTSTLSDFIEVAKDSIFSSASQILSYRLMELGELLVNVPISKMPTEIQFIVPWMGLLLLMLTLVGLTTKLRQIGPTEVFLMCYIGILYAWPFNDTRFWLPVIPFLMAYSGLGAKRLGLPNSILTAYGIMFAILGVVAIAYSTRISFAGSAFPDIYGNGQLRPTYCAAFQSCPESSDFSKVDAKVLRLLRDYN
jgi:hypothetical protein